VFKYKSSKKATRSPYKKRTYKY